MNAFNQINVKTTFNNHWVIVALTLIAIAVIIGANQYRIRKRKIAKFYGDGPYLALGIASAITIGCMLFVESHAGIIQLLDNLLRFGESPILSIILTPFAAAALGIAFGIIVAIIGDSVGSLRRRSLIKKLRRAKHHHQIRRGQPTGKPRPGATRPTRYNEARDIANHRKYYADRVNADKGMHRR